MDLTLVMFKPNGNRKDFPVKKPVTTLGRGEICDLQIPLENVSRTHCEISVSDDEVKVKDLASSNGTYVNNKRINESPLKAGDRLVIGPIVFTIQIDGVPEEITPIKTQGERQAAADQATEEIVDLEADVVAQNPEDADLDVLAAASDEEAEEIDPIAALEALAAEGQKKDEDE